MSPARFACIRIRGRSEWTPTIIASWRGSWTINSLYSYSHIGNITKQETAQRPARYHKLEGSSQEAPSPPTGYVEKGISTRPGRTKAKDDNQSRVFGSFFQSVAHT